jgi:hypothetical protein
LAGSPLPIQHSIAQDDQDNVVKVGNIGCLHELVAQLESVYLQLHL